MDQGDTTPAQSMNVRVASDSDARQIAEVHVATWRVAYRGLVPDEYLASLSVDQREEAWWRILAGADPPRTGALVLHHDVGVVAFAHWSPSRDDDAGPTIGEVTAIYVLPDFWGAGGGRSLLDGAIDNLRQAGFVRATLWVLETNLRARRFYEATGWLADGATKVEDRGSFSLREVRYRIAL
jgi:GNAT superfamily N-acetyltransferase